MKKLFHFNSCVKAKKFILLCELFSIIDKVETFCLDIPVLVLCSRLHS